MSDGRRNEAAGAASPAPRLLLAVEDEGWTGLGETEAWVREALGAVARRLPELGGAETEISVTLSSDAAVRELNREWRGKDRPTNILSFPMTALRPGDRPGPLLGDLILARETLLREAREEGKPAADHFRHLLVHGILHLLGHDHETDADADRMEALEIEILAGLGIPDPYAEPADAASPHANDG